MILVGGQAVDSISVNDRGLAYGDGLFETIAVVDGQPCLWSKHLHRLLRGCQKLNIAFTDSSKLETEVFELSQQTKADGVIKVIITRGQGTSGYKPQSSDNPLRIVQFQKRPTFSEELYRNGVIARFCKQGLSANPSLAGIKHLCRLEQVLARMEWQDEYHEGIMFDDQGNAIEGTMSNLFIIKDSMLKTPKLDDCGVRGVMREWILEQCAQHHVAVEESRLDRQAVLEADGLFFCNALIRVWPVRRLENRPYSIESVHQILQKFTFSELGIRL